MNDMIPRALLEVVTDITEDELHPEADRSVLMAATCGSCDTGGSSGGGGCDTGGSDFG